MPTMSINPSGSKGASPNETNACEILQEIKVILRNEVYAAIDSERDYQDGRWGASASSGNPGSGERTIDEFALYISAYSDDLKGIASHALDPTDKLDSVRKVAGLCVACLEQHGAPRRVSY